MALLAVAPEEAVALALLSPSWLQGNGTGRGGGGLHPPYLAMTVRLLPACRASRLFGVASLVLQVGYCRCCCCTLAQADVPARGSGVLLRCRLGRG